MLLTCRVSSFHYSMGSGTTETWSRHFVREPRIAALCRPLPCPFVAQNKFGIIKIRVLDLSEYRQACVSLACIRNVIFVRVEAINMEKNDESTVEKFIKIQIKQPKGKTIFRFVCVPFRVRDTKRR